MWKTVLKTKSTFPLSLILTSNYDWTSLQVVRKRIQATVGINKSTVYSTVLILQLWFVSCVVLVPTDCGLFLCSNDHLVVYFTLVLSDYCGSKCDLYTRLTVQLWRGENILCKTPKICSGIFGSRRFSSTSGHLNVQLSASSNVGLFSLEVVLKCVKLWLRK